MQTGIERARIELEEKLQLLERVVFSEPFTFELDISQLADSSDSKAENERLAPIKEWAQKRPCIYELSVDDIDLAATLAASFVQKRAEKGRGYALPRLNNECSGSLYVGQSKSIANRLKQHLFRAPKGTYALNLGRWAVGFRGTLRISAWSLIEPEEPEILQVIEDAYWSIKKPMFGRRGAR